MQPHTIPEPDGKSTSLPNDDDAQEKTTCPNDFTKDIGQKEEYLVSKLPLYSQDKPYIAPSRANI